MSIKEEAAGIAPEEGRRVWRGFELAGRPDWITTLPDDAIADLESVVARERARGNDSLSIDLDRYHLPSLTKIASDVRAALAEGYGFSLVRGFPVQRYAVDELKMMLLVFGNHIGIIGPQDDQARNIGEVMDTGPGLPKDFYFQRGGPLPMHMDPVDVVGLLCVRKAQRGGESAIASSMAVHNQILRERPDLLELLYRGFPHIRRHDPASRAQSQRTLTGHPVPVFAEIGGGERVCAFISESVMAAERAGLLRLSAIEREALAHMERTPLQDEFILRMDLQPGDLQMLNNRSILHSRFDYQDYPERERRRLMLRMWLTIPGWRKFPANIPHLDMESGAKPA